MPSPSSQKQNKFLPATQAEIEQCLPPATRNEIAKQVSFLTASLPAQTASGPKAVLKAEAYICALSEFCLKAIESAVALILKGKTDFDPRFCPTPPQVAQLCRSIEDEWRVELERDRRRGQRQRDEEKWRQERARREAMTPEQLAEQKRAIEAEHQRRKVYAEKKLQQLGLGSVS